MGYLESSTAADEYIECFNISVDDALTVEISQGGDHLLCHLPDLWLGELCTFVLSGLYKLSSGHGLQCRDLPSPHIP